MLKPSVHNAIYRYGLLLLLFLLPFNMVASNTVILILAANWFLELHFAEKFKRLISSPFILLSLLWFLLICVELLFTRDPHAGHFAIEKKLSMLCFPLVIGTTRFFHENDLKQTGLQWFCRGTLLASLIVLVIASIRMCSGNGSSVFFYHELVAPLKGHAVYFSIYAYISAAYLYYGQIRKGNTSWMPLLSLVLLSVMIVLLSSRLIIGLFMIHAVFALLQRIFKAYRTRYLYITLGALLFGVVLLFSIPNPVKTRFSDLRGDMVLLNKKTYESSDYFNAWQLRLTLWKFSLQILNEKQAWLLGITPGDAQALLDEKIKDSGMYVGDPTRGDRGNLGYNCHNQYVETLFQTGIAGLIILLSIIGLSIQRGYRLHDSLSLFITMLFCYFFLTESALERMMGIIPFFIFLSLLHAYHPPSGTSPE